MVGEITYSYRPEGWSQSRFLATGGFTIVFLNYNKVKFVEKSVASALNQDYELLEMFFMDDASTDGSGDIMESMVRQYRGRHKVTVVRNSENQHITGQWNIVSKLATGMWLGMFCGDDEHHRDRVSVVATMLKMYPTALGICTTGDMIDENTGANLGRIGRGLDKNIVMVHSGQNGLIDIADEKFSIVGATAFWHRSLFDVPLPKGPLDDVILRWILVVKTYGLDTPNFIWNGMCSTIDYMMGSGVTSSIARDVALLNDIQIWMYNVMRSRYYAKNEYLTWRGIYGYMSKHGAPGHLCNIAERAVILNCIALGPTWRRVCILPQLLLIALSRKSPYTREMLFVWIKKTIQELLGLRVAAFVSVNILKRVANG